MEIKIKDLEVTEETIRKLYSVSKDFITADILRSVLEMLREIINTNPTMVGSKENKPDTDEEIMTDMFGEGGKEEVKEAFSSDNDRLEKEFKKMYVGYTKHEIWNWILSHAKELGELV